MKGWSFSALTKALKALAFWEPVDVYKAIYPVGICILFANTTNPNAAFPGTTWTRITDAATVRAAANAAGIGTVSGSDSFTLSVNQIPAHSHAWSGTVNNTDLGTKTSSSFNYGSKTTESGGQHNHRGGLGAPGASYGTVSCGTDNQGQYPIRNTGDGGSHVHTVNIGAHQHTTVMGQHAHGVSGSNTNTGGGQAVTHTGKVRGYGIWQRTA